MISPVAGHYPPFEQSYRLPGESYELGLLAGSSCFELDADRPRYLAEKATILAAGDRGPFRSEGFTAAQEQLVWRELSGRLKTEHATDMYASLDELAAAVQEDVVVMTRSGRGYDAEASYVHVCFPSGWCPRHTCGKSWLAMHGPVPAADSFRTGEQRKGHAAALFGTEPWARFVWTLKPDARLDRAACALRANACAYASSATWDVGDAAHVRVERQVVLPVADDVAVFLIRVYEYPVHELGRARRAALLRSVDSIYGLQASGRTSLAQYKSFPEHAVLRQRLERTFASQPTVQP